MLTAVIPTRSRPKDLFHAIQSLCKQSKLPKELIVVDQSLDDLSFRAVNSLMSQFKQINLIYIHDPKILGLVDAKRIAVNNSTGDLICFLEDDIVLEHEYIEQIELGFIKQSNMIGCCGIITNPPKAIFQSFSSMSFKPIQGYLLGLRDGSAKKIKS